MSHPRPPADASAPDDRPTVLCLRALGLGDMCTAVPVLRALRRAFPAHALVLAGDPHLGFIAEAAGVDTVSPTAPLGPIDERFDEVDLAVNLHGRGPESTCRLLERRPAELWAHRHPDIPETSTSPEWPTTVHEVDRWCTLLRHHGVEAEPTDLRLDPPTVPPLARDAVVIHPGAAAPGRRWPATRFAAVARRMHDAGERVVITGSTGETSLCADVASAADGEIDVLAGRTDLVQLCALVAAARLVVCNDTGVAHLATAYGTPSVVLFGPTPPDEWGPRGDGPHVALWTGRRGDPHAAALDPALGALPVEQVVGAAEEVLGAR